MFLAENPVSPIGNASHRGKSSGTGQRQISQFDGLLHGVPPFIVGVGSSVPHLRSDWYNSVSGNQPADSLAFDRGREQRCCVPALPAETDKLEIERVPFPAAVERWSNSNIIYTFFIAEPL